MGIDDLIGKTIDSVSVGDEEILFHVGVNRYRMWHMQDCCESVFVDDVCGDWADICGSPVLVAEEVKSHENPPGLRPEYQDSFTWTFYKIDTAKGGVTIRWYGQSNGYYSEEVDFDLVR